MITKPTLLIDKAKAKRNIRNMARKAQISKVEFRPHFKTHFSAEIGEWYREFGVEKITVSSIDMAVYFAKNGWKDITIAFPVNILEIETLNKLASEVRLNLVVESVDTAVFLNKNVQHSTNVWLKIDTGYGRTGIGSSQTNTILEVVENIQDPLKFMGLLTHFGHTYKETDSSAVQHIHEKGVEQLTDLKSKLQIPNCLISIGDTPSCSLMDQFDGVDEVRPGNFIFYDLMQEQIGACDLEQISVCMACPVVAIHTERNELVIHGGAVHFSKDSIPDEKGKQIYGKVVKLTKNGWENTLQPNVFVKSLSQEHGILSAPSDFIKIIKIGELLGILPVHSCLTANLMKDYGELDGTIIKSMNSIL